MASNIENLELFSYSGYAFEHSLLDTLYKRYLHRMPDNKVALKSLKFHIWSMLFDRLGRADPVHPTEKDMHFFEYCIEEFIESLLEDSVEAERTICRAVLQSIHATTLGLCNDLIMGKSTSFVTATLSKIDTDLPQIIDIFRTTDTTSNDVDWEEIELNLRFVRSGGAEIGPYAFRKHGLLGAQPVALGETLPDGQWEAWVAGCQPVLDALPEAQRDPARALFLEMLERHLRPVLTQQVPRELADWIARTRLPSVLGVAGPGFVERILRYPGAERYGWLIYHVRVGPLLDRLNKPMRDLEERWLRGEGSMDELHRAHTDAHFQERRERAALAERYPEAFAVLAAIQRRRPGEPQRRIVGDHRCYGSKPVDGAGGKPG